MSLSCLLFSNMLPLAKTERFLVKTQNGTMHAVAPKTKPNETDQKSVGSSKEVGHLKRRLEVGQDYSLGNRHDACWKCRWKLSSYCKWVVMLPKLQLSRVWSWVILYQIWRWCFILVLMLILTYCDAGNCRKCRQCAKKEGWCIYGERGEAALNINSKICRCHCKRCKPCKEKLTQGGPIKAKSLRKIPDFRG